MAINIRRKRKRKTRSNGREVKIIRNKRWSKIDDLFKTERGKERLNQLILAMTAGAYCHVAARAILGIHPSTFAKWIMQGRAEPDSLYGEFRELVLDAISNARLACELEVRQADPKFWLRFGPGRMLGDNFNDALTSNPLLHHNLDGTVSPDAIDTSIADPESQPARIENQSGNESNQELARQAIAQLIESGVDVNQLLGKVAERDRPALPDSQVNGTPG